MTLHKSKVVPLPFCIVLLIFSSCTFFDNPKDPLNAKQFHFELLVDTVGVIVNTNEMVSFAGGTIRRKRIVADSIPTYRYIFKFNYEKLLFADTFICDFNIELEDSLSNPIQISIYNLNAEHFNYTIKNDSIHISSPFYVRSVKYFYEDEIGPLGFYRSYDDIIGEVETGHFINLK